MDKTIVQQIADQLKSTLAGITKNAGYSIDLDVTERALPINEISDRLCIVVPEDAEEAETNADGENERWWYQPFAVVICLIGKDADDGNKTPLDARQNEVWADVFKQIMLDRTLNGLALDVRVGGIERDAEGLIVPVRVHYRTLYDDITQQ
jgi:hypothetical protein